jgi:formate/nitrite transporter FocA (FNT family)
MIFSFLLEFLLLIFYTLMVAGCIYMTIKSKPLLEKVVWIVAACVVVFVINDICGIF